MVTGVEITHQGQLLAICNLPREDIEDQCQPEIEDSESDWEEDRSAFDFMENFQLLPRRNTSSFLKLRNCFDFLFAKDFSAQFSYFSKREG